MRSGGLMTPLRQDLYYKGSKDKGECGAFSEFQKKYPEILFRRSFDYGYSGRAFIAYKIN